MSDVIVAVIATLDRTAEIARLLSSLEKTGPELAAAVIVDNGRNEAVRSLAKGAKIHVRYHAPPGNLGCGGGLRAGGEIAIREFPGATHLWILDDDTVVPSGMLEIVAGEMRAMNAGAACPMVLDGNDHIAWLPGLEDRQRLRVAETCGTQQAFLEKCGGDPISFSWAQGISLLVSRSAIDEIGFHRPDYWVRGEDLEFSLRITAKYRGIFVPKACVLHLPPAGTGSSSRCTDYYKHCAMLQNIAYTSLHLSHGRRIARTLPGNYRRFFREWGFSGFTFADGWRAFSLGGLRGKPAGAQDGDHFRLSLQSAGADSNKSAGFRFDASPK